MIAAQRLTSAENVEHRRGPVAGTVCITLTALFLTFDSVLKVLSLRPAVEGTAALGYPVELVPWIGIAELVCVAVYLVPRTSVLGGLLLTGYLGGAVATHVRISSPLATHVLFPIYVAIVLWLGLYLRNERLRQLLPLVQLRALSLSN
jgi:DoxX-like family